MGDYIKDRALTHECSLYWSDYIKDRALTHDYCTGVIMSKIVLLHTCVHCTGVIISKIVP